MYAMALEGSPGCDHHHVQVCVILELREVLSRDGENQPKALGSASWRNP